jgi:hypothetical protein
MDASIPGLVAGVLGFSGVRVHTLNPDSYSSKRQGTRVKDRREGGRRPVTPKRKVFLASDDENGTVFESWPRDWCMSKRLLKCSYFSDGFWRL